ncbi:4-hydroxy-tetrahydrodipicolinate synthase [Chitinophaga terrae (ex Kim and Jung 2007)]|uniref:4-hydroxy-tetrahydrodipicolinate synthase n=1 Tax=Chitinophaga terrae (ex Kim and Jung 2007) TaxID=408074 RepID=A0A1H4GU97_9BACT|nr:4-hydroxy-tetrahydrodipicolinate synthase [Chitinophaga terrae (ex Kim and Jung 2007)]MDQ0108347.1 4-hydroxy-tetrahydrodipicolinate synthase [Chitinophaga terrae (ex Kim and Jung 2007)]GEP93706.1 4-hydroxy-tetrahydrodipicolinate synthase [Chitinophaga terrae (ex Kim and Jung 2007)]SEB12428.1 4-hydroxy-tetrahydrodipicolinate synthase [Chitinophaga terrae (ex Kim and Jung 2007)]
MEQLKGTGVALVTPFKADESIDWNALERLINHVIDGGVNYVVSLGTTGETPTLSAEEKVDLIKFTFEKVAKRVPVVVGIGDYNTKDVVKRLEKCPLDEAAAILSVAPYYSKPSQEGIIQHYKTVAAASPKPIILYNVPGRTGRNMTAATTLRLAHEVENIVAMKEASGDMVQCMQIIKDKPKDFLVVSGDDALALGQLACGMEGVISVAANYFAADFSSMVQAALLNDFPAARALNYKMLEGFDLMFAENNPAGIKAFLHHAGLLENSFRLPVVPVSNELYAKIGDFLKKY